MQWRGRNSSVGTMTGLRIAKPYTSDSIPGRAKRLFLFTISSPPWGPINLSNWYQLGVTVGSKTAEA